MNVLDSVCISIMCLVIFWALGFVMGINWKR